MTISDMIANARAAAVAENEALDPYWGEYPRVMKLLVAYYGGFNVGNMDNYNRLRGQQ